MLLGFLATGALVIIVVLVYLGAQSFTAGVREPEGVVPGSQKPWKVEVVNITGQSGAAQRATNLLRSMGYDVVDYHSRPIPGIEKSIVIDRKGDPAAAAEIAAALGLTAEHVMTKVDQGNLVDVTVVVAFDARMYPTLRKLLEKGK